MAAQPYDQEGLEQLREFMEDKFDLLLQTFNSDVDNRISSLEAAVGNNDVDTLRREAHALKGSSGNVMANPLSELCLQLEHDSKDASDARAFADLVNQIKLETERVKSAFEALLRSSS